MILASGLQWQIIRVFFSHFGLFFQASGEFTGKLHWNGGKTLSASKALARIHPEKMVMVDRREKVSCRNIRMEEPQEVILYE
jgi:hypothetical protein